MNTSTEESSAPPQLCNRAKGISTMTLQISEGRGWNVNPFRNKRVFLPSTHTKGGLFRRLCHSFSEPKTKMYFLSMSCLGEAWLDSLGQERKGAAARRVYSKTNSTAVKHPTGADWVLQCRQSTGFSGCEGRQERRGQGAKCVHVGDLYGHNALGPKPGGPAASDPDVSLWYRIRSPAYGSAGTPGYSKQTNPSFPLSPPFFLSFSFYKNETGCSQKGVREKECSCLSNAPAV